MSELVIRPGESSDLPRLLEIYNHYVTQTSITFDLEPITLEARRVWFEQFGPTGRHRLWVAERGTTVLGYAASHGFRVKRAYDTTVETSIYCAPEARGGGVGRALYTAMFDALKAEDIHAYIAGITLPNDHSIRLHTSFGFRPVGVMHGVGRKFGVYWDVAWYERVHSPAP